MEDREDDMGWNPDDGEVEHMAGLFDIKAAVCYHEITGMSFCYII